MHDLFYLFLIYASIYFLNYHRVQVFAGKKYQIIGNFEYTYLVSYATSNVSELLFLTTRPEARGTESNTMLIVAISISHE